MARLLEIFFPTEEELIEPEKESSSVGARVHRKFSIRLFEMLNFDLRMDEPKILERILQRALIERYDPLSPKNAFFILNRIISFTREASKFITTEGDNKFGFGSSGKPQIWEQFIVAYGSVQESQIHLVRPLLPVIREVMKEMSSGWWRVLIQKGLCNDSVPIRRLVLHFILSGTRAEDLEVLCTPDGLDFCLEDFLVAGLDANASFLVAPQHILEGDSGVGSAIDLGEATSHFFASIIETFSRKSPAHGQAILRELLVAVERMVRAPVALIYILKAFSQVSLFPALEDVDLIIISKISCLISLHNQRARLLVKRQLTEIIIRFSNPSQISFAQLIVTLYDLLSESLALGEFNSKKPEFAEIGQWLDNTFGANFLKENLTISIERYFRTEGSLEKARILALLMVFSLGSGDGRFIVYSRPILERLALIKSFEDPRDAISAFTMFLALNKTVRAVLCSGDDLLSFLGMESRIFSWLEFIDETLFGEEMRVKVDFPSSLVLLEAFSLLIERADEDDQQNNQNQLIQFLEMHFFSQVHFLNPQNSTSADDKTENNVDLDVGFKRLLTVLSAMTSLSAILGRLNDIGHLQPGLITPESIQKLIRFKLERPGGLSETEWDQWPEFVTAFTASKWKCIEAMSRSLLSTEEPKEEFLSVLSSCLQALEVSKYGGTLAILKCMSTLFDLILDITDLKEEDGQICYLTDLTVRIFKNTLVGGSETQRWFDFYAEAFIALLFRPSILKASEISSTLLESIQEAFEFIVSDIGPKRRGIVSLMSLRMGEYWISFSDSLSLNWRTQLMELILYGPVRASTDETVAARINCEHVPDSDYQVRVHALTVLNHLKDGDLGRDFLVDLLGHQEAKSMVKKRMFPGDFGHRIKLRSWSAILLLIGVLCNIPGND